MTDNAKLEPCPTPEQIEEIARCICFTKGYDPDGPAGEDRVQWQTFTELAQSTFEAWNTRAAIASLEAKNDDGVTEGDALRIAMETVRQRSVVLFQAYARSVSEKHGRSEDQFIHDVTAFSQKLAEALQVPVSVRGTATQSAPSRSIVERLMDEEMNTIVEQQAKLIEELVAALKPFADAADEYGISNETDEHFASAWEHPIAMSVRVVDFVNARTVLLSCQGVDDGAYFE